MVNDLSRVHIFGAFKKLVREKLVKGLKIRNERFLIDDDDRNRRRLVIS